MFGRIHKNDDKLYSALTGMGYSMVSTDLQGNVVSLNEQAEKLTGWTVKEAVGKHSQEVLRLVNYDTRMPLEYPMHTVLSEGKIFQWDYNSVLLRRGGNECAVEGNVAPLLDARGRIEGAIILFRNVTERFAAEQKLLESEERLKAVTNAAHIGLVMIDRERRYIYANNFYIQMLGIANVNLIGREVGDVLPLLYERIRPNLDKAFSGERLSYEVEGVYNKEKGLNRIYSVTYEPQFRHSLVVHVVIIVVDITEIKRAAKAGH